MKDCPTIALGQLTTTINGLWTGKKPPFINIAVIRNTNFSKDCRLKMDDIAMIDVEVKQYASRKLQRGDIIIEKSGGSDKQPVGRPVLFDISDGEYSFSNFTSTLRVNDRETILPEYLHKFLYKFYLSGNTAAMQSKTTGLRNLDFYAYRAIKVPVPSIEEQQCIVDELDLLTGIIDKKNAQLRDLDALAQSIFYDMFGDPITNEKGWSVKAIKDSVVEMFLGPFGSSLKTESYVAEDDSFCMVYEQKHAIKKTLNLDNHYIDEDKYTSLRRFEVLPGDFIMSCRGTIGEIFELPPDAPRGIIHPSLMKIRLKRGVYEPSFFKIVLGKVVAEQEKNGGVVKMAITAKELGQISIIVPPIDLQQRYEERLSAILDQQEKIEKSLIETQNLLNSRMIYYFG